MDRGEDVHSALTFCPSVVDVHRQIDAPIFPVEKADPSVAATSALKKDTFHPESSKTAMIAAAAPLAVPSSSSAVPSVIVSTVEPPPVSAGEARKRRRDILTSQRIIGGAGLPDAVLSVGPPTSASTAVPSLTTSLTVGGPLLTSHKKRRVSTDGMVSDSSVSSSAAAVTASLTTATGTPKPKPKKPQMKYDPDVPMTKEEAAVWRREQRRKRNRESAAASRQRQRDRITELEAEVEEYKVNYAALMRQIRLLEDPTGAVSDAELEDLELEAVTSNSSNRAETPEPTLTEHQEQGIATIVVTPQASVSPEPAYTTVICSSSSLSAGEVSEDETHVVSLGGGDEGEHHHLQETSTTTTKLQAHLQPHPSKLTSRPAAS